MQGGHSDKRNPVAFGHCINSGNPLATPIGPDAIHPTSPAYAVPADLYPATDQARCANATYASLVIWSRVSV